MRTSGELTTTGTEGTMYWMPYTSNRYVWREAVRPSLEVVDDNVGKRMYVRVQWGASELTEEVEWRKCRTAGEYNVEIRNAKERLEARLKVVQRLGVG